MKKSIYIQTQGLDGPSISPVKPVGFVAINFDGLKMTIDGYDGFPCNGIPRENSRIEIITDKECFQLTPEQLIQVLDFFCRYSEMGNDVPRFKNAFHVIMPDLYRDSVRRAKKGLKI